MSQCRSVLFGELLEVLEGGKLCTVQDVLHLRKSLLALCRLMSSFVIDDTLILLPRIQPKFLTRRSASAILC